MPSDRTPLAENSPRIALRVALMLSLLSGCVERNPTEPDASQLVGVLNGASVTLPGGAGLLRSVGAPDTLLISGWGQDVAIRVQLEYTGPGTYALGPEHVEVLLLVGGDVRTGGYGGSVAVSGELRVLQANGAGAPFQAALRFDAEHSDGEQRFGPTAAFRGGQLTTRLQVWRP